MLVLRRRLRRTALLGLALGALSCFGGAPTPPVTGLLAPASAALGPRHAAPLAVVFAGPRGPVVDRQRASVTILFNRAMRDIDAPDVEGLPALRLTTAEQEPVAGSWRWVGAHGLLFTPAGALPGSTRFEVTVPAGTRSVDGETLAKDYAFEFSTARPNVTLLGAEDDFRRDSVLRLAVDQRVAPAEIERAAHLVYKGPRAALQGKPRAIGFKASAAAAVASAEGERQSLLLRPAEPLPLDGAFELTVDKGLRGEGPLVTLASSTFALETYGPIRLADLRCPRDKGPRCQAHRDLTVVLSNPVAPDEFKLHFRAPTLPLRKPEKAQAGAAVASLPPSRAHLVRADPDYGKRYRVTLTAGLRDVFGQKLERDLTFDVDTEAAFVAAGAAVDAGAPAAATPDDTSGDDTSGTEPERPDYRPRRPALAYDVALGLRGHVVEAKARSGVKSHQIPVGAVNTPSYAMFAGGLPQEQALDWLGGRGAGADLRWTWVNPGAPENIRSVRTIDLDPLLGGADPRGAALLALARPGAMQSPSTTLLTVTDLALSAQLSGHGSLIWVTRLSSGEPVSGAVVSARKAGKPELFSVATDAHGLAAIPAEVWNPVGESGAVASDTFLVARAGADWTYQRVERASASYKLGIDVDLAQRGVWTGMLYTDRGVYRPGEALKVAGVLRKVNSAGLETVEGQEVRVSLEDSEGDKVFDGRARLDAFGELALDVPVPRTSHLGQARVSVSVGRASEGAFSASVLLAAYKASEFKVSVDPDRPEYVRGEVAHFAVGAEYLFGGPMGGAAIHNHVSRLVAPFTPARSEGLVTGDEASVLDHADTDPGAEELRSDDGALDADGRYATDVKLDLPRMRGAEEVTFESEVSDLTHQTVARRARVRVHPAAFYLGIERPTSTFVSVGADVHPNVVALTPQGARTPGARVKVELVSRTWTGVVEDEAADVPRRRSRVHDEVSATCELTTTEKGASCPLRVSKPGYYILRARAKDGHGNDVGASLAFYCLDDRSDQPASPVAWADPEGRGLKLEADKKMYDAGDVARILVRQPFKEASALVTVERAGVLWQSVVTLRGPMPVVEVPVRAEYFPNAFVTVRLVRGRVLAPPERGADVGAPDFRLGTLAIHVDPGTHRLKTTIATARKEYRPGDEVDADVRVTGSDGRPARGALTFYAVDEGVLMLTSYRTPDPLPAFAGERRLAVFSVESREALAQILPIKNGERVKPLGYEYLREGEADKGADGGGGGDASAVRADFKTTAFFESGRVTGEDGRAHYHFKLPDNLTTFRLMAVVAGADDRFGAGEATITTRRELMVRPSLPRRVRAGDAFEAGAIVSAAPSLAAGAVDVTLRARGVSVVGPSSKRVSVPKGGSVEVRFPVKADAPGEATFELAASGAGETDRVRVTKGVDLPVTMETVSAYGETPRSVALGMGDLKNARADRGGVEVHLASTALVGLATTFERAIDYPYGCSEQLASRLLPLLALPDMASAFGARMPARVETVVDDALAALLEHQRGSGGFGFWESDRAVPWLSAYAMLAVETAARKGYIVSKDARDHGIEYLRHTLDTSRIPEGGEEGDGVALASDEPGEDEAVPPGRDESAEGAQKQERAYATLAFVADVLASVGQPDPGYLNRLFDARAHRPLFSQALLLHAMAVAHMPKAEVEALGAELAARLRVDASTATVDESDELLGDMLDSPSRTAALTLRALLAADPHHPLASRLARGLLGRREGGAWRSTQENVWALLALDDYRRAQEAATPDFDARLRLGQSRLGEVSFRGRSTMEQKLSVGIEHLLAAPRDPLVLDLVGSGTLYYAAELRYASSELPARAADEGFFVQKLTRALRPADLPHVSTLPRRSELTAPAGQLVLVDLLFESPEPREQVVIDDPLPSGLEPIDFALDTSAASQNAGDPPGADGRAVAPESGLPFRSAPGLHREQHDDRVLTFLPHVEPGLYHFRYLARATTPGRFVVPPTRAECMYSPEVWGRTAATTFVVGGSAQGAPVGRETP